MSHAQTMRGTTLADALFPAGTRTTDAATVLAMSWIIALCAQLQVVLPHTPVPLTGSTLGVLYAGALLGSRRGAAAVGLYLVQGACGLPFFAGGATGLFYFLAPSGGYLAGFLPAAYVTGLLAERGWDRSSLRTAAMMLLGSLVIFACGLAGLSRFVPADQLLAKGLFPFIPGDILKAGASAALLPLGWRWLGRK